MNIFVLCTGRCGSLTFAKACGHATNFTAAHESRTGFLGPGRVGYAAGHIEVDNRLSWFLGRLEEEWGDRAFYVHLTRDNDGAARSYLRRRTGIVLAYRSAILL